MKLSTTKWRPHECDAVVYTKPPRRGLRGYIEDIDAEKKRAWVYWYLPETSCEWVPWELLRAPYPRVGDLVASKVLPPPEGYVGTAIRVCCKESWIDVEWDCWGKLERQRLAVDKVKVLGCVLLM